MKQILFTMFNNTELSNLINDQCDYEIGSFILRDFPDGETYIKINSKIKDREVIILVSLDHPNPKILPLIFTAQTIKVLGAKRIGLVAPYLPYMRQDKQFHPGEGLTSNYFAALISQFFDWVVTIDPHLHRRKSLSEIYKIPATVLHASDPVVNWVRANVTDPFIIGPDKESEQWVSDIAKKVNAPYIVLEKIRKGDRVVEISLPSIDLYHDRTPVLMDDIISTGKTMIATIAHLKNAKTKPPICIGVHGIFAENAYEELLNAGANIITCNTINHESNKIDISPLITDFLCKK